MKLIYRENEIIAIVSSDLSTEDILSEIKKYIPKPTWERDNYVTIGQNNYDYVSYTVKDFDMEALNELSSITPELLKVEKNNAKI